MDTDIILETERLRLREWDRHYGRLLDEHCNTPEVLKYLEGRRLTAAEHEELVDWLIDQQNEYGITFWVLEHKETDEFLGFCGLVKVDEPEATVLGATEIGWRLRADRRGNRFASEAARASIHYAFQDNGDERRRFWNVCDGLRVVSRTTRENEPSWRLMQRLGMKYDPRLDYVPHGASKPQIVHVMTRADWDVQKKQIEDTRMPEFRNASPPWW